MKTKLQLKQVPSIPALKVAEGLKTPSGTKLIAFSGHKDSLHIVADASVPGFGGITVIGPGVTTIEMDWGTVIDIGYALAKKIFGGGGGGGGGTGQKCKWVTTVTTDANGNVTSMSSQMVCEPA
jgi:hypothetical protein